MEDDRIFSEPVLLLTSSSGGSKSPSLAEATRLLSSGSESTELAVLVHWLGDPLGVRISTNGLVVGIDQNDFVELVGRVLSNPVRVQDTERSKTTSSTLLGDGLLASGVLQLVNSVSLRLSVGLSLGDRALAVTAADTNTVDHISLLGTVAHTASLFRACRTSNPVNSRQLSVLPSTDTEDVAHHVGLLLAPYFLHVLVRTHVLVGLEIGRAHV